ncbi:glucan endo-1,3-beta-glucosidase 3-like [Tasmannia lanceolata]|uniref:glucan endo-1,3-beta-glucosidase 3-like n=1 Tax=Tasmannia lanceolata TaxID=3420 RepID=UPI004063B4E2
MAKRVAKSLLPFFLSLLTVCCSGTLVGFSYDARRNSETSSPIETVSLLKKNKVSPSQIKVFVADHRVLNSLYNTGISVDLYVNKTQVEILQKSKASAFSWLKNHLIPSLPHINITIIITSGSESATENELSLLLPTLKLIHSALKSFELDHQVKISTVLSLSILENSDKKCKKNLHGIMDFIRKSGSFIVLETTIDGALSLGDQFIQSVTKKAAYATTVLHCNDVPLVLNVKSSAVPSEIELAQFTEKMMESIENHAHITSRICGLFAEISPMKEFEQKQLDREVEQIFPSSHRELLNKNKPISEPKTTLHDTINPPTTFVPTTPITNPVTTPTTVPSTNPTPTIVTVPSTNPITVLPTNPVTTPVTNPITTPVTSPSTVPVMPTPMVPITNPVTTPVTVPITPPVTNPFPPPGLTTPLTPPVAPTTNPISPPTTVSPIVAGQSWCVAKMGSLENALQVALDYACGIGGADCSAIQQTGSCYNPNTLRDHASYAFNSYYQKSPTSTSCDFGGTAMTVNTNPSTGSCVYPSSSSASSLSSSPSVLNTSDPGSSTTTTIFGSQSPPATTTSSSSVLLDLQLLFTFLSITSAFFAGQVHLIHG